MSKRKPEAQPKVKCGYEWWAGGGIPVSHQCDVDTDDGTHTGQHRCFCGARPPKGKT